jgi:hypothetical protein
MEINLGNDPLRLPTINKADIYEGEIISVRDVESDQAGNPINPYVEVKFRSSDGVLTESFYVSEKAVVRLRVLWFQATGTEISGTIDTKKFQQLVGVKGYFKVVPSIDTTGKVRFKLPFDRFFSVNRRALVFSKTEKDLVEQAEKILADASAASTGTTVPEATGSGELPF